MHKMFLINAGIIVALQFEKILINIGIKLDLQVGSLRNGLLTKNPSYLRFIRPREKRDKPVRSLHHEWLSVGNFNVYINHEIVSFFYNV